jgi:predicted ester cyclase
MGLRGLFIGMIVVLTGCNCPVCPETGKDKVVEPIEMEVNKGVVRKLHEEVWSKGNVALIPEYYQPDFVCHIPLSQPLQSYSELVSLVNTHRKSFPDWHENIINLIAEKDMVVSQFQVAGTHRGKFWDIDSTGNRLNLQEIAVFKFRDGKIVEQWSYPDIYGMRKKLLDSD